MKKVEDIATLKPERTIKVKTLVKIFAVAIIIIASVCFGWIMRSDADSAYHANVLNEAQALVKSLK